MPMTPTQLVDMHADLTRRTEDPLFIRYLASCFTAAHQNNDTPANVSYEAEWAMNGHIRHIKYGSLYRVTADMVQVLKHAAAVLDATDKWDHTLAPTPCGIVRFDVPLVVFDIRGRMLKAHWLIWGPTARQERPVTLCSWYNDTIDPDEYSQETIRESGGRSEEVRALVRQKVGRWAWNMAEYRSDGAPLGDEEIELSSAMRAQVIAEGHTPLDKGINMTRYVHALWLLLNQTITKTVKEHPDRASAKRARRMNLPQAVTTVQLRRTEGVRLEGETDVAWQHRWIVRGHWRWQHVSPHYPNAVEVRPGEYRARIYIAPFVKGPEGAPLIDRPKIYDLRR